MVNFFFEVFWFWRLGWVIHIVSCVAHYTFCPLFHSHPPPSHPHPHFSPWQGVSARIAPPISMHRSSIWYQTVSEWVSEWCKRSKPNETGAAGERERERLILVSSSSFVDICIIHTLYFYSYITTAVLFFFFFSFFFCFFLFFPPWWPRRMGEKGKGKEGWIHNGWL